MAPHSSTVARKIPRMEEPGRLQSMGSRRVRHNWSHLAAAAAAFCLIEPTPQPCEVKYDSPLHFRGEETEPQSQDPTMSKQWSQALNPVLLDCKFPMLLPPSESPKYVIFMLISDFTPRLLTTTRRFGAIPPQEARASFPSLGMRITAHCTNRWCGARPSESWPQPVEAVLWEGEASLRRGDFHCPLRRRCRSALNQGVRAFLVPYSFLLLSRLVGEGTLRCHFLITSHHGKISRKWTTLSSWHLLPHSSSGIF